MLGQELDICEIDCSRETDTARLLHKPDLAENSHIVSHNFCTHPSETNEGLQ